MTTKVNDRFLCVVCGDESDGLHFGQYTCRACAAFFRRTVSLKLEYVCKKSGKCEIQKSARNMCRACRYKRCLERGMLTSAVQHSRDGLGKRKDTRKQSLSSPMGTPPESKSKQQFLLSDVDPTNSAASSIQVLFPSRPPAHIQDLQPSYQQHPVTIGTAHSNISGTPLMVSSSNQLIFAAPTSVNEFSTGSMLDQAATFLQLSNQTQPHEANNNITSAVPPYIVNNFSQLQLNSTIANGNDSKAIPQSFVVDISFPTGLRHLPRMIEGYNHFLSLRKASYTLIEGFPLFRRSNNEIEQANFGTSKKMCKIECSLIMDVIEKYYHPFGELPADDKNKLFDSFYCLFSNVERAFRTCKTFDEGDDRLMMPDGGYIRVSELEKFYENNSLVRGNPAEMAKIFEDYMAYVIKVSNQMRRLGLSEVELMVLVGMFIWSDAAEVSHETMNRVLQTRNEILIDLHLYYRSKGFSDTAVTLKTANLFMLIPKIENMVRLLKENFSIAELFNMVDLDGFCCSRNEKCS